MVWDAQLGRVVLWGGSSLVQDYNDTWAWDGTAWLPLPTLHSPPTRILPAFGYDAARSRVVLYGGIENGAGFFDDTWTFDGSDWTQQNPVTVPPGRSEGMLAPDATTAGLVMFGGEGDRMFDETWTWDGSGWTQQGPTLSPAPRRDGVFVYDSAMHADVLFGGSDQHAQALGDTWTWTPAASQPAVPETPWAPALLIPAAVAAAAMRRTRRGQRRKRTAELVHPFL
jgi:hypothetical protein